MSRTIEMMAAPTAMQPGGYVAHAYRDRSMPYTAHVLLQATRRGGAWEVTLRWAAPTPVRDPGDDPRAFADAAALLVPQHEDVPWLTMGAPDAEVEGVLWRADRAALWSIRAAGLGTVERRVAPATWRVRAEWVRGTWSVTWRLAWPRLDRVRRLGVAVWQGAHAERAGLKSVGPGWLEVPA